MHTETIPFRHVSSHTGIAVIPHMTLVRSKIKPIKGRQLHPVHAVKKKHAHTHTHAFYDIARLLFAPSRPALRPSTAFLHCHCRSRQLGQIHAAAQTVPGASDGAAAYRETAYRRVPTWGRLVQGEGGHFPVGALPPQATGQPCDDETLRA